MDGAVAEKCPRDRGGLDRARLRKVVVARCSVNSLCGVLGEKGTVVRGGGWVVLPAVSALRLPIDRSPPDFVSTPPSERHLGHCPWWRG